MSRHITLRDDDDLDDSGLGKSQIHFDLSPIPFCPAVPENIVFDSDSEIDSVDEFLEQVSQLLLPRPATPPQHPLNMAQNPAAAFTSAAISKPDSFNGTTDPTRWLQVMASVIVAAVIPEDRRVPVAASHFRDLASDWWAGLTDGQRAIGWPDFVTLVTTRFNSAAFRRVAEEELYSLRCGADFTAYDRDHTRLSLLIPGLADAEKLRLFRHGLGGSPYAPALFSVADDATLDQTRARVAQFVVPSAPARPTLAAAAGVDLRSLVAEEVALAVTHAGGSRNAADDGWRARAREAGVCTRCFHPWSQGHRCGGGRGSWW